MKMRTHVIVIFTLIRVSHCELSTEDPVTLRWDFTDCGKVGRFGPSQENCYDAYRATNLDDDVNVTYGVQHWTVPTSGLYLITARGPSGLSLGGRYSGRGAITTEYFRFQQGEQLNVLVGQKSDYDVSAGRNRGPGGSGGTFLTRVSDDYVLMVAGGGSSGAGNIPDSNKRFNADANTDDSGKNASKTLGNYGLGGVNGLGGFRGFPVSDQISTSGGGAGYYSNGNYSYVKPGELLEVESPSPPIFYLSRGVSENAPGVGGFFMFFDDATVQNNGGFGGGGSGSLDGGAGGGGGYSGGGGGPWNGWGGGGGSIVNGENPQEITLHDGLGSVTITFIGPSCCGPIVVYIAMCFVAGIIATVVLLYMVYRLHKWFKHRKEEESTGCCTTVRKKFYSFFKSSQKPHKNTGPVTTSWERDSFYSNHNARNFSASSHLDTDIRDLNDRNHGDLVRDIHEYDRVPSDASISEEDHKKSRQRDYDHRDYDRSRRRNVDSLNDY